jgi:iron complex transport system substrate-binding protein
MLNEVRTLVQLGASDEIVATSTVVKHIYDEPGLSKYFSPLPKAAPELGELPRIDYSAPNLEQIIALKPDIILSYGTYSDPTDIPTICIGDSTGGDLSFSQHKLIGILMGKENEASELITYLEDKFEELGDITSKISEDEKPRVLVVHLGGGSTRDIRTVMARYDPIEIAGGINVAEGCFGEPSSVTVSKEQILAWNPDIILLGSSPSNEHNYAIEDVLSDPDLQTLSAVKNKRVYYTKGCMIGWDPATVAVEAFYFAKLFHPDKFADLDVEEVGNEILHRCYGVDGLFTEMAEKIDLYTF